MVKWAFLNITHTRTHAHTPTHARIPTHARARAHTHTHTHTHTNTTRPKGSLLSRIIHHNLDVWISQDNTMMDSTKTDLMKYKNIVI